jgi:hypothetical protein
MLSSQRTDSIWKFSQKRRNNAIYTALLLQLATLPVCPVSARTQLGPAIKMVCAQFVELCRKMGLLTKASEATGRHSTTETYLFAIR